MSTTVYLVISLLMAGFSFFVLYTGKFPIIRMPAWVFFYLSMIIVSMIWVSFFFPELSCDGELLGLHGPFASWGKVCSVFFVVGGFFLWVYLIHKNGEFSVERITKSVAKFFTISAIIAIILISFITFAFRFYDKVDTSNIVSDSKSELVKIDEQSYFSETALIAPGASLCHALCVTKEEALKIAQASNLKYYHQGNKLIVIVHPGDEFVKVCDIWILKSILTKGSS